MATSKKTKTATLDECPCAGRHLEKFIQPAILAVLAEEPLHGYLLVQRLGRLPMFMEQSPDSTGVYRFLKAMEDRGLVVAEWDLSKSGPARKLLRLTAKGRECLDQWVATLEGYYSQFGQMLDVLRQAAIRSAPARKCRCRKYIR